MARKRKSNRTIYIILGIFLVLILFIILAKSQGWIGKSKELEVELGKAKFGRIVDQVSATGMVQPVYEVKISPDVSGEIIALLVEEGDSVKEGQLLIKIRPDIYQSALERAKANLNQQKANLAEARARVARTQAQLVRAEAEYKRNKKLREDKVISESDFEIAEANYKVAINDYESAKQGVVAARYIVESAVASVREAEENLRFTIVTAPISGIVSKLNVEHGERVVGNAMMAGTEMLRIADLTQMEARVNVNENDIIRVGMGDTAIVDVDSYTYTGKKFKGVVTNIANTANDKVSPDAVTEFEVRIRILNDSYADLLKDLPPGTSPFRPGMTTNVDIIVEVKDNILMVPLSAVTTRLPEGEEEKEKGKEKKSEKGEEKRGEKETKKVQVVFVNDNGTARMREVKTGISDFDNIEILEGVKEREEIITGPFVVVSKLLKDGDQVKKKEEKSKKEKKK